MDIVLIDNLQGMVAAASIQLFFLMPYARCQAKSRDGWMKRDTENNKITGRLRKELDETQKDLRDIIKHMEIVRGNKSLTTTVEAIAKRNLPEYQVVEIGDERIERYKKELKEKGY